MCTPGFNLFRLYPGELNFGQSIWHKNLVVTGNTMEIWELFQNFMEYIGNKGTKQKKSLFPPSKEKNWIVHECMLSLPIGCMKFLFPKLLVIIFGLG
jgi:hypothetical protein